MATLTIAAGQTFDYRDFGFHWPISNTAFTVNETTGLLSGQFDDGTGPKGQFESIGSVSLPLPHDTYSDDFLGNSWGGFGTTWGTASGGFTLKTAGSVVVGTITGVTFEYELWEHYSRTGSTQSWRYDAYLDPKVWLMGDDTVTLAGGNDYFVDPNGALMLKAGAGDDTIFAMIVDEPGAGGPDQVWGDAGNDAIAIWSGNSKAWGGSGNDTITVSGGGSTIWGDGGSDQIAFSGNFTTAYGGSGNDFITMIDPSWQGGATIEGGTEADYVSMGGGTLIERANSGDDHYIGLAGVSILSFANGTAGVTFQEDLLGTRVNYGVFGHDLIEGFTRVIGTKYADVLVGSDATNSDNNFSGGAGNDVLIGAMGNDTLDGGSGNDLLQGGHGSDKLTGSTGIDRASYAQSNEGLTVALDNSVAMYGDAWGDVFSSVEELEGSAYGDTLKGSSAANLILGGAGDDTINGASGADTLTGGLGADCFVFASSLSASNADIVTDFEVGVDTFALQNSVYTKLAEGALSAANFAIGSAATAQHFVIYDSNTGALSYDRDGSGATYAAVKIATLTAGLNLAVSDFDVI